MAGALQKTGVTWSSVLDINILCTVSGPYSRLCAERSLQSAQAHSSYVLRDMSNVFAQGLLLILCKESLLDLCRRKAPGLCRGPLWRSVQVSHVMGIAEISQGAVNQIGVVCAYWTTSLVMFLRVHRAEM